MSDLRQCSILPNKRTGCFFRKLKKISHNFFSNLLRLLFLTYIQNSAYSECFQNVETSYKQKRPFLNDLEPLFDQCVACWRWYVEVVAQHKQWCDPRLFFSLSRLGSQRREIVSLQWLVSCSCRRTWSYIVCLLAENLLWDISTWRAFGAGDVGVAMTPPDFGRSAT